MISIPNKGKTLVGSDIFNFTIDSQNDSGQIAYQLTPSALPDAWAGNAVIGYEAAWVIQNGNLDYLKCANKLHWQNQKSCK